MINGFFFSSKFYLNCPKLLSSGNMGLLFQHTPKHFRIWLSKAFSTLRDFTPMQWYVNMYLKIFLIISSEGFKATFLPFFLTIVLAYFSSSSMEKSYRFLIAIAKVSCYFSCCSRGRCGDSSDIQFSF